MDARMRREARLMKLCCLAGVLAVILIAGLGTQPARADGQVRYVAPGGRDAGNDCTSQGDPCASLGWAVEQAVSGDTIKMGRGIYTEAEIVVNKDLIIQGAGAEATILQGHADPELASGTLLYIQEAVSIQGMTFRHSNPIEFPYGSIVITGDLVLEDSVVAANQRNGIVVMNGSLMMMDSEVSDNSANGIYGTDSSLQLSKSIVAFNQGQGVLSDRSSLSVIDTTIGNNSGDGIYNESGSVEIFESLVNNNQGSGVGIYDSSLRLSKTTLKGNGGDGIVSQYGDLYISESVIAGNGSGIQSSDGIDLTIEYSQVTLNRVYGIVNVYTNLSITHSLISKNGDFGIAQVDPDGIHMLTLNNSQVVRNGNIGIRLEWEAKATVARSTIAGNGSGGEFDGGGISVGNGKVTVVDSTINENFSRGNGAGIYSWSGNVEIRNSTLSGNQAGGSGGGIFIARETSLPGSEAWLNNVTITQNTADADRDGVGEGGGIASAGMPIRIQNSLIAENHDASPGTQYPDCSGALESLDYNLIGDLTGCSLSGETAHNVVGLAPRLGGLRDNGGPTRTHALLRGSPAIGAGNPAIPGSGGTACEASDQRGVLRDVPPRGVCDIGAFER